MYKFVVVTDTETASGFRLAGADVIEIPSLDEAAGIIMPLLHRDDMGIVAINEEFMSALDEKLVARIEKTYRPIIIPIPVGIKRLDRTGYMERLLQRAIGYNIVLRK
jgi:V/A-type H+-transporting ATPase subunit F